MALKPGKYNPQLPDIELFDFKSKRRYGLKLEGSGAMQIGTISQDDSVHIRAAGKRVGDFDEQRSWQAGRGHENLSETPEGFWDSHNMWTLSGSHIYPTLLWQFARGIRACEVYMPNDDRSVSWKPLLDSMQYLDVKFSTASAFTASYARIWIKKVGTPGTLTFKLYSDSAGNPSTLLATDTITADDVSDVVSVLRKFSCGAQVLAISTSYHLVIYGADADNNNNHWKVGVHEGGSNGKYSTDGSSWTAATFAMYHYVADSDIGRRFFSFNLNQAFYIVDKKDSGAASQLWINGDRGIATSANSNSLTDSAKAWTVDRWAGAFVKIVAGAGSGTIRQILSNTVSAITISGTWSLDATSQYIIYGTEWFTEITSTGLGVVTGRPIQVNNVVYFPQGATAIRHMVWNSPSHSFGANGTNTAHHLEVFSSNGVAYIARGYNDTNAKSVSTATPSAWAASPAALVFGNSKNLGDGSMEITSMCAKESYLYVLKGDGIWQLDSNLNSVTLQSGIDKTPSRFNGMASIAHSQFIFFSWMYSVVRIYGSSVDDVGQDWSSMGLPAGREGNFSSLDSYTSLLIASVDAGETGTSCVLGFNGVGWHEILRAYDSGKRSSFTKVQVCEDDRNRLWTDFGGDLVFQKLPFMKSAPWLDTGCRYVHEAVIESSAIDMGTASGLPKFVKEITVFAKKLSSEGNEINVDYQVDENVHTSTWTEATTIHEEPESAAFLGLDNIRKFSYRLRVQIADNANPPDILGVTPNGYARTPMKMVWTLRCRADNVTSRGRLVKPDELMRWLLDTARFPGRVMMLSQYELAHKFFVIVHPPRMFPFRPSSDGRSEESSFTIVLEEA